MKRHPLLIAALLVAMTSLGPGPARADITAVTVRVDGLSCPFCAYSLEKKIKAVRGTTAPVTNVEMGVVTLMPRGDSPVDFDALREAVEKAGFTLREIRVVGQGRLATIDARPVLVTEDGRPLFVLARNDALANVDADPERVFTFGGTVVAREDGDDSPLRTLSLHTVTPRAQGDGE